MRVCVCVCMCVCARAHVCVRVCAQVHVCEHICMCASVCVSASACVRVLYVCICAHLRVCASVRLCAYPAHSMCLTGLQSVRTPLEVHTLCTSVHMHTALIHTHSLWVCGGLRGWARVTGASCARVCACFRHVCGLYSNSHSLRAHRGCS